MRIFTDGCEMGNNEMPATLGSAGGVIIDSGTKRSGNYSYRVDNQPDNWSFYFDPEHTGYDELYFKFHVYFSTPNGTNQFLNIYEDTTVRMDIRNVSNYLQFYVNGSLEFTHWNFIISYRWILVEVHIKLHSTDGEFEVKVNGEPVYSHIGFNTGTGNINRFGFWEQLNYRKYYIDNIAINDTTGSYNNSWCGDGEIIALVPDGDGDVTQLVPSTGSNYACVDEIPPNTTDYTSGSDIGDYDLYTLGDTAGLFGMDIKAVHPMVYAYGVSGDYLVSGVKSGSTEQWDATPTEMIDQWMYMMGEVIEDDPDGGPLTYSVVDSMQVGIKTSGS